MARQHAIVACLFGAAIAAADDVPRKVLSISGEIDCRQQVPLELPNWFDCTKSWRLAFDLRCDRQPPDGVIVCWGDERAGLDPICLRGSPQGVAGWVQDNVRDNRDVCRIDRVAVAWNDPAWKTVTLTHDAVAQQMTLVVDGVRTVHATVCPPRPDRQMPLWLGGIGMTIHRFPCWIRDLRLDQGLPPRSTTTVTARLLKLYNVCHGPRATHGTLRTNVSLWRAGEMVWRREAVRVAWLPGREVVTQVELPRDVPFDTLRLDITDWIQPGAGLCELQVFDAETPTDNLALGRHCETNSVHVAANLVLNPVANFSPSRLTDGVTRATRLGTGYWLASDAKFCWVEVRLTD